MKLRGRSFDPSLLDQVSRKQILDELDRLDAEENLIDFIRQGWHILEPGREFVSGWHIEAICEHLEAVTDGDITRLLINVPPGCMKSMTVNVFWPSWEWGPANRPSTRYVSSSYSQELTVRDNRKGRTLISSDWYRKRWGDRFHLMDDQNAKTKYENNHSGFRIATSVGGLGTGERGDRFIIDDPHNVKDGESEAKRHETLFWFREVVPTRVNDPEKSSIVIIMQRVHEEDVSGVALAEDFGYEHLMLPMEFEPERKCIIESTKFEDPREEENELLWSERMTRDVVERDKKVMGMYASAGQFQQRPSPRGGGLFQRVWFKLVDESPKNGRVVRGWDLASTEKSTAAYTAGVRIRRTNDGNFYIEHVARFRGTPGRVEQSILNLADQDREECPSIEISIPQDPGQAGKSQKRHLSVKLVGHHFHFSPETGSKESRANGLSSQAEAGNVYIVKGPWNGAFFDELETFPFGKFKDQIDAASRAYARLIPKRGSRTIPVAPQTVTTSGV